MKYYNVTEKETNDGFFSCPVCGQKKLWSGSSFDECSLCGWIDNIIQTENPNERFRANDMSLNQARRAWNNGERIR